MLEVKLLLFLAIALVFISLTVGVVSMARGGEFDFKHSTQFMFARVGFQAAAILILLLALSNL